MNKMLTKFCIPRYFKECKQSTDGHRYVGTVSVTATGIECQRWDSQYPHTHARNDTSRSVIEHFLPFLFHTLGTVIFYHFRSVQLWYIKLVSVRSRLNPRYA